MSDARHRRLEDLFQRGLELDAAGRDALFAAECAGDPALRREVEDLLAREPATSGLRVQPFLGGVEEEPERIGHYRILHRLGEGGFGVVYAAEQEQPIRRRVALKVLKPGMDSRAVLARFETERQTLALMDHTHIARVFDAGATERGRPYVAMELVDGVPITTYCDRERLSVRARLELFVTVCEAIQHAHQKGVIHRDLKPSNILVAVADGRPLVKVIDFGIAKAIAPGQPELAGATQLGQLVGTPEYMSPEQAAPDARDVDTRSDIWALGVVLYELLTGTLPFATRDLLSGGLAGIQRALTERDAARPSTRVTRDEAQSGERAAARGADARTLARTLRGDLDWIVLRALERDRERRYQTANALALDVTRHLHDQPVDAGPPGAAYRIGKFVRRHRAGIGIGAAALLALFAIIGAVSWALVREKAARAHAETALSEARAVTDFLSDLIGAPDPNVTGHDVTVRSLLQPADSAVALRFADRPAILVQLRTSIGRAWHGLGDYPRSERILRAAESLGVRTLGEDARETVEARSARIGTLQDLNRVAEAESLATRSLERLRRTHAANSREVLGLRATLASLAYARGRFAEAESLRRALLREETAVLGERDLATLTLMAELGNQLAEASRFGEAESLLERSWRGHRAVLGPGHASTLTILNDVSLVNLEQGRDSIAEPQIREVVAGRTRLMGEDHPLTMGARYNLAATLSAMGRYAEAEPMMRSLVDGYARRFGADDANTLVIRNNLARLYFRMGRWADAERTYRAVIAARVRVLGPTHPATLGSRHHLANTLREAGRYAEAAAIYEDVLATQRATLGEGHMNTLGTEYEFARLLLREGRLPAARAMLERATTGLRAHAREVPRDFVQAAALLGSVRLDAGDAAGAGAVAREGWDAGVAALPAGDETTRTCAAVLARIAQSRSRAADVATWLARAGAAPLPR